jgi:hypothetical protein
MLQNRTWPRLQGMDYYRSARPFAVKALATAEPSLTAEAAPGIDRSVRPKHTMPLYGQVCPGPDTSQGVRGGKFKPLV